MRFFEDIEIGAQREFGSFTFTADDIKKFATQFDPQRFHLDEEEGRKSLFGGLAASGWHVAAVCMKLLVADGKRLSAEAVARGEKVAVWGPSPGFRELRWIKPVLAGDTIHFSNQVETKRTSAKRPEWGILQARNTGINQRGEVVFSFLATAFVPRRSGISGALIVARMSDATSGLTAAEKSRISLRSPGYVPPPGIWLANCAVSSS